MSTQTNSHKLPNQEKWITLTSSEVKHIFAYYIVIFLISLIAMIAFIRHFTLVDSSEIGMINTVLFSFSCGLLGGTFYYIRKLYKSCIQLLFSTEAQVTTNIKSLGVKVYFYFRPIMGAVLSILVILGVYGGFFVLLEQPAINSDKFYIFVALLSFATGFSNGKLIVKLDNTTDKIAEMISGSEEGK